MPASAKKSSRNIWVYVIALVVVAAIAVALVMIFGNKKSNNVEVSNTEKVIGLECTDNTITHPALTDFKPQSFQNTITANFRNNTLSTITYRYEGVYANTEEATNARNFAEADYNIILARELNTKIDIFSHHFVVDGNRLYLTISTEAENATSRTAGYFLLDSNSTFPKTLEAMKKAYQFRNFSCKNTK